jgi:hypothetical protein
VRRRLGRRLLELEGEFRGRGQVYCRRIVCPWAWVGVDLLLRGLNRGLGCGGGWLLVVLVSRFRLVVRVGPRRGHADLSRSG